MQVVVYDANVLYPSTLRDVLIRAGVARLVRPRWTEQILDEVFRNLLANRPDLDPKRLQRTRQLMDGSIRDVRVTGYEHRVSGLELPDLDDRHVLAAAIHAGAQKIITNNLRDFPAVRLDPWGISAENPDDFLSGLHEDDPQALCKVVAAIADAWGTADVGDVLRSLDADAPRASGLLRVSLRRRGSSVHGNGDARA